MVDIVKNELKYKSSFDQKRKRYYLNDTLTVLHCHHYTTLYSQLALDADETSLLKECARESFREMLTTYFENHPMSRTKTELSQLCAEYYKLVGLGKMKISFMGPYSGEVVLESSHLDEGWKKKWGTYDKPVNYITAGFIEAVFETVYDTPAGMFLATETQSIVQGAETSVFNVTRR